MKEEKLILGGKALTPPHKPTFVNWKLASMYLYVNCIFSSSRGSFWLALKKKPQGDKLVNRNPLLLSFFGINRTQVSSQTTIELSQ